MNSNYTYKPPKTRSKKFNTKEQQYIKTIARSFIFFITILVISFFGFIALFSNINNVWGFFRGKEIYNEETNISLDRPFLDTEQKFTKEDKIELKGTAQAGGKVVLYKNNSEISDTIADSENKYTFSNIEIDKNENVETEFYTITKDDKGNESNKSNVIIVFFDKTKPKLEVRSPEPDQRIKSISRTLEIQGTTEKDTEVKVNGRIARINLNNEFSATIRLEDEVNVIVVTAKDKAGNETKIEVPVYFDKVD